METSPPNPNPSVGGKRLVVIGGFVVTICLAAILSSFLFFGKNRFVGASEIAEAHMLINALQKGLVNCAKDGGLPVTTSPVPGKIELVAQGKTYVSGPHDWDDPAFACAAFSNHVPQHFQIQWERLRPDHGRIRAQTDTDGDGHADIVIIGEVHCDPEDLKNCEAGPITP